MELTQEIFRSLGMTLVHSLWQGSVIAALVLFSLTLVKKTNAQARYVILFSGLTLLLVSFFATFIILYRSPLPELTWQPAANVTVFNTTAETWPVASLSLTSRIFEFLEPWYPAIAMGWMAGFVLLSLRFAGGAVIARIRFSSHLILPDPAVKSIFDFLMLQMGIPFKVKLRISGRTISPLVTGILQPMVIIPMAAVSGLSTDQIRTVIIHELAHIRRYDHLLIFIQAIARQVVFFHPLTWFLNREIDRERENCCDDYVITAIDNPLNYLKALAMIQEMKLNHVPANGLTGKRSYHLLNRITRLVKPEMKHSAAFRFAMISLFIATIGISTMAFIITDRPDVKNLQNSLPMNDDLQPDMADANHGNGTVNFISEDRDGDKKKMKIVFSDDTITQMTVNGKPLNKEEMKQYAEEIRKVQEELRKSREELRVAQEKLNQAQKELQIAQLNMENLQSPQPYQFNFNQGYNLGALNPESFKWDKEKFTEEMKKAREEGMKAFQEAQKNQENWNMNKDEWKKEMEKAFEESQKNRENFMMNNEQWKKEMEKAFKESQNNRENFMMNNEQWKKEMEKLREESKKNHEYWDIHREEFDEQMKKAAEEAARAMEEYRKNGSMDDFREFFRYMQQPDSSRSFQPAPPAPQKPSRSPDVRPVPDVPNVPEIEKETEIEVETGNEVKTENKEVKTEMDSTLRELEGE